MTYAPFAPLDSEVDRETAFDVLRAATAGADDGELFFEQCRSEALVFDDGRLKTASYDAAKGFGLRAVRGEVAGYAHSTEISESALRRAADTARLAVGDGGGTMADAPQATNRHLYTADDPIAGATFPVKLETLKEVAAYLRDLDSRVVQVSASMAASLQEIEILRADGHTVRDVRPMSRLNISVIVEQNGRRESGSAGGGGRVGLDGLIDRADWQAKAREALRVAVVNLDAVPAPAGVMDVVLGPGWPGILLHEAIGHGLEGDFNRKGSSAFAGLMGEQIAAPGVTVLDDGTIGMRTWTEADEELLPSVKFARQNGVPIIEPDPATGKGVPGSLVTSWLGGNWSGSAEADLRTLRGGACMREVDGRQFLIYAYFSTATPSGMGCTSSRPTAIGTRGRGKSVGSARVSSTPSSESSQTADCSSTTSEESRPCSQAA